MIREVGRKAGRALRAATTMTVTADNLAGVPAGIRWLVKNADAFRLISFQSVAQVGRTLDGLGGTVTVEALWAAIAEGFSCSRYLPGVVVAESGADPVFHPIRYEGDPVRTRYFDGFLERFGGVTFRLDSRRERAARILALALRAPGFVIGGLVPYAAHWCRLANSTDPLGFAIRLIRGSASVTSLVIVSHHFMSEPELKTALGQERLGLCVFHVPVDGRLVPMCEVNATGMREHYYTGLAASAAASMARAIPTAEEAING